MALDKNKVKTLWADTISKYISSIQVYFDIIGNGDTPPPGHQFIKFHMIFDAKMADLQRKTRMVARGRMTDVPLTIMYDGVVSPETLRVPLTVEALNDMNVKTDDIMNAYIKSPYRETLYTILGTEFVPDEGKMEIVFWDLYGLNIAGASFWNHLSDYMKFVG